MDHLAVHLVLSGSLIGSPQSGFDAAGPGDLVIVDTRRASRTEAAGLHMLTLSVPRTLMVTVAGPPSWLHGRIESPSLGGVLADLTLSVLRRGGEAAESGQAALRRALMETLGGIVAEAAASRGRFVRSGPDEREAAIGYIASHLGDRELNAHAIAAGIGSSRSSVYRALKPLGGVAEVIMIRRLAAVRDVLEAGSRLPLSALAAQFGFTDESHLNRRFAAAFDQPAGAFRRLVSTEVHAGDASRRRLESWVAKLG